jgi:hypothetical protein
MHKRLALNEPGKPVKKSFTFCCSACHSLLACVDGLSLPFLLTGRMDPDGLAALKETGTRCEQGWQSVLCSRSVHTKMLCSR